MPKVSVIVPVYNVEDYLEQCVKSILSQTLEDIEVLLVNDASTDGSLKVARSFETDKRVRVLEKPHGGLGDTRNYGVARATGEYLALSIPMTGWTRKCWKPSMRRQRSRRPTWWCLTICAKT